MGRCRCPKLQHNATHRRGRLISRKLPRRDGGAMGSQRSPGPLQVRAAREAFLSGDRDPQGVRPEVLASWRRCELNGVNPDRLAIPYTTDFEPESNPYRIATPILH